MRRATQLASTVGIVMAQELDSGLKIREQETLHGSHRVDLEARVQVASVQTLTRRLADPEHRPDSDDLIVFDEAHWGVLPSCPWQRHLAIVPGEVRRSRFLSRSLIRLRWR